MLKTALVAAEPTRNGATLSKFVYKFCILRLLFFKNVFVFYVKNDHLKTGVKYFVVLHLTSSGALICFD